RRAMRHSLARSMACVVGACALVAASPAFARGRHQQFFRLDLRTGKVEPVSQLAAPRPVLPWPDPRPDPRRSVTSRERTLFVLEGEPGDPGPWHGIWEFTLPGT